ncbi:ABC transporter substrate-binding protein [Phytoactinopolyspora limicola]|uniref:ABC transporter substrate-binding protein n=1 Tax=Phytoactinopolyspora limicola TaxID=2715536 RepID=UPI00140B692B|nr:ABC transporter substrate-binding protein [Phytoactinopolyspora limicola]
MRTRRWLPAVVGVVMLAACAGEGSEDGGGQFEDDDGTSQDDQADPGDAGEGGEPVRVGVLMPFSGPVAVSGELFVKGWELYWETHGTSAGGRTVEWVTGDTQADPSVAVEEARRLVEQENIDILVGPLLGSEGLAVGEYTESIGLPQVYGIPASEEFLRDIPDTIFRYGITHGQVSMPFGEWAAEQGYERVSTICSDYVTGWEICGGFINTFTDNGGEIVTQLWPPFGDTADLGPFMAQLAEQDHDAVYLGMPVGDAVAFFRAWTDFGLLDTVPVLGHHVTSSPSILKAMGLEAEGMISAGVFTGTLDDPVVEDFATRFEEAYGEPSDPDPALAWHAGALVRHGLEELDGDVSDADEFIAVLKQAEFPESVLGPLSVDEHGNVLYDVHIREARDRGDGVMENFVIDTYEQSGPNFRYDYDMYVEQPAYNRDYQGFDWPENCDAYISDCPLD